MRFNHYQATPPGCSHQLISKVKLISDRPRVNPRFLYFQVRIPSHPNFDEKNGTRIQTPLSTR
jgi:hypothetical protein